MHALFEIFQRAVQTGNSHDKS